MAAQKPEEEIQNLDDPQVHDFLCSSVGFLFAGRLL